MPSMQVPDIARELPSTRPQAFKLRESTEDKSRVLATWAALLRPLLTASLRQLNACNAADTCRTTFSAFERQVSKSSKWRYRPKAEVARRPKGTFNACVHGRQCRAALASPLNALLALKRPLRKANHIASKLFQRSRPITAFPSGLQRARNR